MKILLLHNKKAGDRDHTRGRLLRLLRRHGYEPAVVKLDELLETKHRVEGEFVVVAGGDGSVKRAACALAGSGRLIAILPTGTANNIARSLGIRGSIESIIAGWTDGKRIPIDLGIASGPWGRRFFIESLGVGLVGRSIAIMSRVEKIARHTLESREDRLYRDLCVMLAVASELQPVDLRYARDRKPLKRGRFLLWELLNIRRAGPGVPFSRSADPSDGFLDLVAVGADERSKLQALIESRLAETSGRPGLSSQRVRQVRFTLGRHELRLDDELVWPLPADAAAAREKTARISVSVDVSPGALECLLPAKAAGD